MFERIANGWQLAKSSWHVLRADKELLVFPLVSGIACLLVGATFAVPLWMTGFAGEVIEGGAEDVPQNQQLIGYLLLFAFYFVNYFVIVFFNAGLVACAVIRFHGGDPTLGDGFSAAFARLPQIAGWAAVAATVGVVLKVLESRSERVGTIAASLLGMAWSIVTYFIVPVIVIEKAGPLQAAKRSAAVLRKSWGESLVANFGIGLIVFFAFLVAAVPLIAGVAALSGELYVLGGCLIAIGVALILLVSLISSALNSIIVAALYLYAAEGQVPDQFESNMFRDAFARRSAALT